MSLRVRMGVAAGVAVALAVIAVAASAYGGTRSELRGQVDHSLQSLAHRLLVNAGVTPGPPTPDASGDADPNALPATGPPPGGTTIPSGAANDCDQGLGLDNQRGQGYGEAQGIIQLVSPTGTRCLPTRQTKTLPVDSQLTALAKSGKGSYYGDVHVGSQHLRVAAWGVGYRGALEVALPLNSVDSTLRSQLLLLALIAAGGVALAAVLGLLVARTALAPIARFTKRTESIATNPDLLDQRLEVAGRDELARLARTFNATLDSLSDAVNAQRNLVADASHELRTPIASLRANLQLLRDESRLPEADRAALREDMIEELDELTGLVGDVVELARGREPSGTAAEVRLDEVASEVVERTRRRAPELTIGARLEPTLVHGEGTRIARAVANLLDNARKWSPGGGRIEVTLKDGALAVRDHGPGFKAEDLPFVFDRFHRAKDARSKPGSGLGLAIVKQAAEAHGGFAKAANADGGGAVVTVGFGPVLELEEPQPVPAQLSAVGAASTSRPAGTSGGSGTGTAPA
jgi:two-component system sensor histidine kinase MprB